MNLKNAYKTLCSGRVPVTAECAPPSFLLGRRVVELSQLSKGGGGLTGPQFLAGKEGADLFQRGAVFT